MLTLSKTVSKIGPSATLTITSLAKSLKSQGKDVINFAAGEPDFDTPKAIKEAAKKAIDSGFTKYTPASGMSELKQAICDKFLKDNALKYSPGQIVVSCGAKHSLYNVFQAICNPGDEVIIIAPYWVSYPEMAVLSNAKVKVIRTSAKNGFRADLKDIKKAISKNTKAIVLNSPSNPAGVVYSKAEFSNIADVAVAENLYVISDEIYEKLIYDGEKHVSIGSLGKDIYDITITVNGVSKAYSMTGWRIGYLGANERIVKAVSALQGHSTSNPTSISQWATLEALKMDDSEGEEMRKEFESRRDLMMGLLDEAKDITYVRPKGAFYLYCDISKTGIKAQEFAKRLLAEKLVAVIPGESFGSDKHVRLSFAIDKGTIKEGINRIKSWVRQ